MRDAAKKVNPQLTIGVSVTDDLISKTGMILDP